MSDSHLATVVADDIVRPEASKSSTTELSTMPNIEEGPPAKEDTHLLPRSIDDVGVSEHVVAVAKEEDHTFRTEYDHVKEAIEEHLQEADDGEDFF